jgi:hypothetical protein
MSDGYEDTGVMGAWRQGRYRGFGFGTGNGNGVLQIVHIRTCRSGFDTFKGLNRVCMELACLDNGMHVPPLAVLSVMDTT